MLTVCLLLRPAGKMVTAAAVLLIGGISFSVARHAGAPWSTALLVCLHDDDDVHLEVVKTVVVIHHTTVCHAANENDALLLSALHDPHAPVNVVQNVSPVCGS